jgi:Flp pilus assembly pilin Flp
MHQFFHSFWLEEDGQDLMEYSLFLCFVALACTAFLAIFHPSISTIWQSSSNNLQQANTVASGS